jgi:transcriptional regulator with XRE-family HTH domain
MARDKAELLAMGARIKELRELHGLKQQYIADKVGVELRTYQFWQAGKSPPEQENLEKLAELFGVTPKYILKGDTPEPLADDATARLDAIEQRLAAIEEQLGQLLGAASIDGESRGDLADRIVKTVERAINQRASEVARPPQRRGSGRARSRRQDAA